MRVFVDTSVWVDHLRNRDATVTRALGSLLARDGVALAIPVRIELLSGVRSDQAAKLGQLLAAVPTYLPTARIWSLVEQWALEGRAKGYHFGVGDLLVGSLAAENSAPVWSLDTDFETMAALGFLETYDASVARSES